METKERMSHADDALSHAGASREGENDGGNGGEDAPLARDDAPTADGPIHQAPANRPPPRDENANGSGRESLDGGRRDGVRVEPTSAKKTVVQRFRLVQINDVYILANLPRLATFLVDDLGLPDRCAEAEGGGAPAKKNLPHRETRTDRSAGVDDGAATETTTTTHTTTVVTVSGDFLGPSLLSSLDGGSGMVDVLHAIGVTHVSLGNHEDDVPCEALVRHVRGERFEWVNTNLRGLDAALDVVTEERCLVEVGGLDDGANKRTVALLGLLSDDPGLYRPDAFGGAVGAEGLESPAGAIERMMDEDDAVREADLIVPLTHLDMADDVQLAERFGGGVLPVIIGGHDHDVFDEVHSGCRILKTGSDAHRATVVEFAWRDSEGAVKSNGGARSQRRKPPEVSVRWIEAKDYEPHPAVQQLVEDRRRVLQELETARLFRISEMLDCMRESGILGPGDEVKFSTSRNRYGTTAACSALCGVVRQGMHADCCALNAGGMRGNRDYKVEEGKDGEGGWFTFADLKSEMPFPDAVSVVSMPGRVLERAIGFSRRKSRLDPPEEDSGLLHLCNMVRYTYEDDEDGDGRIAEIGGEPFQPDQDYDVALPIALLNGMDNNVPLLDWTRESGLRMSEEAGKPVKIVFVETFALSFWSDLGSFADIDKDGKGVITRCDVQSAIAAKMGLDCGCGGKDAGYLKYLVDDVMAVADVKGTGTIDLTEFLAAKLTASIQEVAPSERRRRRSMRPSVFLQNLAQRELGRNAGRSSFEVAVKDVKSLVRRRASDDMDEDVAATWSQILQSPNQTLSIKSQGILE